MARNATSKFKGLDLHEMLGLYFKAADKLAAYRREGFANWKGLKELSDDVEEIIPVLRRLKKSDAGGIKPGWLPTAEDRANYDAEIKRRRAVAALLMGEPTPRPVYSQSGGQVAAAGDSSADDSDGGE